MRFAEDDDHTEDGREKQEVLWLYWNYIPLFNILSLLIVFFFGGAVRSIVGW